MPDNILFLDQIFLETDIARGLVFKRKGTEIVHIFTIAVDLGKKYIEKFRGGFEWFIIESKDCIYPKYQFLFREWKWYFSIIEWSFYYI